MTLLIVLGTFLFFILLDFFLGRNGVEQPATQPGETPRTLLSSASVEGILVPDQLRYHPGHTWLGSESADAARIGLDALAVRMAGSIDRIEVPKLGRWVRQGQTAFTVVSGDRQIPVVSPAEGEVTEVNPEILRTPDLVRTDPYGKGWLIRIHMPDPAIVERNLLPSSIVRTWMKEELHAWRSNQPVAQTKAVNGR